MKAKVTAVKVQNPESEDSELSGGAIAGIVVGCVAVVAVFVVIAAVGNTDLGCSKMITTVLNLHKLASK